MITPVRQLTFLTPSITNSQQLQYETSFTARIDLLSKEISRLSSELEGSRSEASAESKRRREAENENDQLRSRICLVQEQLQETGAAADGLRDYVLTCFRDLDKVIPVLEDIRQGLASGSTQEAENALSKHLWREHTRQDTEHPKNSRACD